MKPLVIVLSRNYSTGLGVIRSLGAAGYTVDLVASVKKKGSSIIASKSKYIRNVVEVVTTNIQGDEGKEILNILLRYAKENDNQMVLFPTDDFTTFIVDNHRKELEKYFLFPTVKGEKDYSVSTIMDKAIQGRIASNMGLSVAKEYIISLKKSVSIPEKIEYPCFVKPLQSISGNKSEMSVCNDEQQLTRCLLAMKEHYEEREVMIQQYLNIEKEYDMSGVCLENKVIIPAIIEKTRVAQHERGVTMTGTMVSTEVLGEAKEKLIKLFEELKYIGMFDVELFLCNGEIYFNEINFRSGGPNYSYFLNGVNLPAIFVEGILGREESSQNEEVLSYGKTFVYEKVAWEDYMHSFMTKRELQQCINEADYKLLNDSNDPGPGKCFEQRIRLSALKNKVKNGVGHKRENKDNINNSLPVVVVGRNYCNILAMTRALGEAGYDVEVVRVFKKKPSPINLMGRMKPDASSKYVKKYWECIVAGDSNLLINNLLENASAGEKKLILPVDDYTVSAIDESLEQLENYYIVPSIREKAGAISCLMDKDRQKQEAEKTGLPLLKSELVKSENGKFSVPENLQYPCFVKPNKSANATKAQMKKCHDKNELNSFLEKIAEKNDFEMLVEKFADIKAEYSVLGVSTNGVVAAPCIFKVLEGGHKERKGVTLMGKTVSSDKYQHILDECETFVKNLGYEGIFDIDLIETKENDIYFIEINFRAGASMHVFTKSGINLPGIFADAKMKNKSVNPEMKIQDVGKTFVSEKILLEEFARSDIGVKKILKYMKNADVHFIKDEKDSQPYSYFKKFYIVAAMMRIPYRIRDYLK